MPRILRLLKFVDRKVVLLLVLLVGAMLVINLVWGRSVANDLDRQTKREAAAQQDLNSLRTRLDAIRQSGVSDGAALFGRVARFEALVPGRLDDLALTQQVVNLAATSQVEVGTFEVASQPSMVAVSGLTSMSYAFTVTGDYPSVVAFLERLVGSGDFVATISSLTMSPIAVDGSTGAAGLFVGPVTATGTISFWGLATPGLTGQTATPIPDSTVPPATTVPDTTVPGTDDPETDDPETSVPDTTIPSDG